MTVRVALFLAVIVFVMQAAVVRPRLWPAGAGLVISGDTVLASLGEARIFAALRPPDVKSASGQPATIARVWPRDRLRRQRVMAAAAWAEILGGMAAGVEAAHGDGILHRDLKPENILLPESGTGPKVLDFGIAKATASNEGTLTAGGTVVGTPAYMAPEQLRGERLDARTDVYSLGVMTYEALTGSLPFGAGSFVDVAMRQAGARAHVETTGLSPAVANVVLGAIAYERDERPATPTAFADAIRRAIGG